MSEKTERLAVRAKQAEAIKIANEYGLSVDIGSSGKPSSFSLSEACGLLIHVSPKDLTLAMIEAFDPADFVDDSKQIEPNNNQKKVSEIQALYWWVEGLYIDSHEALAMRDRSLGLDDLPLINAEYFANWAAGKGFQVPVCFPSPRFADSPNSSMGRTGTAKDFVQSLLTAYRSDVGTTGGETLAVMLKWATGKSFENYKNLHHDKEKVFGDHGFSVWKNSLRAALKQLKNND